MAFHIDVVPPQCTEVEASVKCRDSPLLSVELVKCGLFNNGMNCGVVPRRMKYALDVAMLAFVAALAHIPYAYHLDDWNMTNGVA